jgi:hypothetical protein
MKFIIILLIVEKIRNTVSTPVYSKNCGQNYSEVKPKIPHAEAFDKKKLIVDPNPKYLNPMGLFNDYTLDHQRRTSYIFDF